MKHYPATMGRAVPWPGHNLYKCMWRWEDGAEESEVVSAEDAVHAHAWAVGWQLDDKYVALEVTRE